MTSINVEYEANSEDVTFMRVVATKGYVHTYSMLEEYNGIPHAKVFYHKGLFNKVRPDGSICKQQGKDHAPSNFEDVGDYLLIACEDAEWDCITPSVLGKRVVCDEITESGTSVGHIYVVEGRWRIDGQEYVSPFLISFPTKEVDAVLLSEEGVLWGDVRTEEL